MKALEKVPLQTMVRCRGRRCGKCVPQAQPAFRLMWPLPQFLCWLSLPKPPLKGKGENKKIIAYSIIL